MFGRNEKYIDELKNEIENLKMMNNLLRTEVEAHRRYSEKKSATNKPCMIVHFKSREMPLKINTSLDKEGFEKWLTLKKPANGNDFVTVVESDIFFSLDEVLYIEFVKGVNQ